MSEDATTKPTIETVLERVNALGDVVNSLGEKIDPFREYVEVRLGRVESMTNRRRAEMLTPRADFRELSAHIRRTA